MTRRLPEIVQAAWEDYRTKVVPPGEREHVLVERRRCFFAGASSLFNVMMAIAEASDEEGEAALSVMKVEFELNAAIVGTDEEKRRATQ